MHIAYKDYYWKNGKPYGRETAVSTEGKTYRIVVDPYYRRFSVEEYWNGNFGKLVYDSALFDFRILRKPEYAAWHKEELDEENSLIRNEEDRVVLIESYLFEEDLCRSCLIATPYAIPVAYQRMFYVKLGDSFNGVILHDAEHKLVMKKVYNLNEAGEFGELVSETWEPEKL